MNRQMKVTYLSWISAWVLILFLSLPLAHAQKKVAPSKKKTAPKEIIISEAKTPVTMAPKVTSINFRDESLEAIIKSISKLTGKSFILNNDLSRKKVTIIAREDVTIEEAYRAFLSALEMNDLTVVPVGKFLKVVRAREAPKMSLHTYAGKYAPTSDGYITRIHHLKYIKAQAVSRSLQAIVNPRALIAYPPTNSLIITDTGSNINRLIEILEHLDVKGFEEDLDVIKIEHATARDVAEQLSNFYQVRDQGRSGPVPRFGPIGGSMQEGGGEVISKIIPDPRTNSIIVKANAQGLAKIKNLIKKLDLPVGGGGKIHVYYLQNSQAKKISATLQSVVGSGGVPSRGGRGIPPIPIGAAQFEGQIKVTGDEETNSLVITASLQDYETLKSVIDKLDIQRRQVYVEAYILEIAVAKEKELGVSYTAGVPAPGDGGLVGGFGGSSPNALEVILDPTKIISEGGILGFVTGGKSTVTLADGTKREIPNGTALVKALATDTDANLLSAPQILAIDNVESLIEISEKVPIATGTTTTATGIVQQSVKREPIGLTLKITPRINETSEMVRLEIDQVIEAISLKEPPSALKNISIGSTKRAIKTTVLVKNTDTVVIGGLLRDNVTEAKRKVPLLGDIPILGWLFKSTKKIVTKTNLMLLLTPTIVKKYGDFRKLFDKKFNERQEFLDMNYTHKDRKTTYLNRLNPPKKE